MAYGKSSSLCVLHHPDLSEQQVFERGRDYITRWLDAGWIQISDTPVHPSTITALSAVSELLQQHGSLLATWKIHPRLTQLKISLVPANRVRQFARAKGILAKTDRIDAKLLCAFGEAMQ